MKNQQLTNKNAIQQLLNHRPYNEVFGGSLNAIFKPFTTFINATGYSHYNRSVFTVSGLVGASYLIVGADSSGLNPYGSFTLGEGIVSGPNPVNDLDNYIDPSYVRTYGTKFPMQAVGFGYDIFGYPAPNWQRSWGTSGIYSSSGPSTFFAGTGDPNGVNSAVSAGKDTPPAFWRAGPVDIRWDNERKVWSTAGSVQAGIITKAYTSGTSVTNYNTTYPASTLTYDAEIQDGIATRIRVTGVSHLGTKPFQDGYYVYPLSSGDFCFVVRHETNSRPKYGVWAQERPGLFNCDSSGTTSTGVTDPAALGYVTYNDLLSSPLSSEYGGIGGDTILSSGTLLMGHPSGDGRVIAMRLTAGSGLVFSGGYLDEFTKEWTLSLSTGIAFITAGYNNTITQLAGLTTPLSIAQGGTGASGKVWVDLTTDQTAYGIKSFPSGLRSGSGTIARPSYSFQNDTDSGFFSITSTSGDGMGLVGSGVFIGKYTNLGNDLNTHLRILSTISPPLALSNLNYAPLVVKQYNDVLYNNHIQVWLDRSDNKLAYLNENGRLFSQTFIASGLNSSGLRTTPLFEAFAPSGMATGSILFKNSPSGVYFSVNKDGSQMTLGGSGTTTTLTSTSGTRTIHFSSGYHGSVDVARVGGGTRTLNFMHGLFTGYTDS